MKRSVILVIAVILSINFVSSHPVLSDNYVAIGKGCTTAYYIDEDCDGYGVGQNYLLGVDADDTDPDVNTLASVNVKYGDISDLNNLKLYMQARGYSWDNTVNAVYYISPNGNDATGQVNDINYPYRTFAAIKNNIKPGDLILFREGINEGFDFQYGHEASGDGVSGYIIAMAYPGEKVFIYNGPSSSSSIQILGVNYVTHHWIFDGFILGSLDSPVAGYAVKGGQFQDIIFRNFEIPYRGSGFYAFQDMHNIIIERCVMYGSANTHEVYLGARDMPNSNITFRNNIIYNGGGVEETTSFQHNGAVTNLVMEGNIIHSGGGAGAAWLNGADNSVFKNNLLFNNNKQGFMLGRYPTSLYVYGDGVNDNNQIINNVIWSGLNKVPGGAYPPYYAIQFFNSNDNEIHKNNIIKNNILVSYGYHIIYSAQLTHMQSATIENNLLFRMDGQDKILQSDDSPGSWTFAEFEAISSNIKNNLVSDPLFTDVSVNYYLNPENFNFYLTQNSPAIDTGSSAVFQILQDDLIGNPRPMDGDDSGTAEYDIGCYEYDGPYIPVYQCSDGIDNDGDGYCDTAGATCTDGSTSGDAGCSDPDDNDETNCGDGVCEGTETCQTCSIDCVSDNDDDGYDSLACGGNDCDDTNANINPGATEICDGIDNNCVSGIDENNGDCSGSLPYCVGGGCVECVDDSDCVLPETCNDNICSEITICDGFALLMHFDEDSSTIQDFSVNQNHGAVNGATFTSSGKFSGAYEYDGSGDYIEVSNDASLQFNGQAFSVAAWVKFDSIGWNFRSIVSKDNLNYGSNFPWVLTSYGPNIYFKVGDSTGTLHQVSDSNSLNTVDYFYIAATFDPDGYMKIYVNGAEKGSLDVSGLTFSSSSGTEPLRFGVLSYSATSYEMDGIIDEVVVWDRDLTSVEVDELFNNAPISCGTSSCTSGADEDKSGSVSIDELIVFIDKWKAGSVTIAQVLEAVGEWKRGC